MDGKFIDSSSTKILVVSKRFAIPTTLTKLRRTVLCRPVKLLRCTNASL